MDLYHYFFPHHIIVITIKYKSSFYWSLFINRSPEWANAPSDCVPPPNQDDGEFYMEIHDFMNYFDDVTICNLTPDFDRDGNPNMLSKKH